MKNPTHTVIETPLDLSRVEDMLYDKYLSRIAQAIEDPFMKKLSKMANVQLHDNAEERAEKWAENVVKELQINWKARILRSIDIHLTEEYYNPYDPTGQWDSNPILSRMLTLAGQDKWDMVVSEIVQASKRMGDAFPINLTNDEWLDIRVLPIEDTTDYN